MKNHACAVVFLTLAAACTSGKESAREDVPETQSAAAAAPAPAPAPAMEAAKRDARMAAGLPPFEQGNRAMKYPATPKDEIVETLHGTQVADPYRWLEDEKAPRVQEWMKAQDALARQELGKLPMREKLAARLKELLYQDVVGVPVTRGGRLFYVRNHADKEKGILYWRDGEQGKEKVLLDPNQWTKDGTVSLGVFEPSWDGKKVAFTRKPNSADEATLHVVDVDSGKESEVDVIPGAKYADVAWTPDSAAFHYEWLPEDPKIPVADRPGYTELRLHKLGTEPRKDVRVHPRTGDPSTFLSGDLSRDGKYFFAYVQRGWLENDVYLKRPGKDREFKLLVKGKKAKYSVHAWKDQLYILTDEGAPRQRIFKASGADPVRAKWKELIPEDKEAAIESWSLVGGHLAVAYLRNAVSELRYFTLEGKPAGVVPLPGLGSVTVPWGLEDSPTAYFAFSSFVFPKEVYRTTVPAGKPQVWGKLTLPLDPSRFVVDQVFYPSKDGTRVSMFVVHRKDLVKDGSAPTILYGYGGFDVSMTSAFKASIYPWLEAGGVWATPNLRGGGEYGAQWHEAGMRERKQNVFDDFLAAAEYLTKEKYTQPKKLGIYGGSNGGLLVGAAMVQRPELFGAVVCAVPLLDMVRYHKFGSGMTWVPEYGNADVAGDFRFLHAYSPYHHVAAGTAYPPMLMMSADHDDRVDPLHARKFVAAVQAASAGGAALLRIEANSGHGGADMVKQSIEQNADLYAFFSQTLGLNEPRGGGAAQGSR